MQIKDLINSNLYDENEQVVILHGDVNNPTREYTGRLSEVPTELQDLEIEMISSLGEIRRTRWNLNKYGWFEIWVKKGE